MMVSPGLTRSVSLTLTSFFSPSTMRTILHAVHRAVLGDPAGERQRLQHGRVLLQRIAAGVLHLAEHVDRLRARHEDRVAVAQLDVLRQRAALEVADRRAEHLGAAPPGSAAPGPSRPAARARPRLRRRRSAASSRRAPAPRSASCRRSAAPGPARAPRPSRTPAGCGTARPRR